MVETPQRIVQYTDGNYAKGGDVDAYCYSLGNGQYALHIGGQNFQGKQVGGINAHDIKLPEVIETLNTYLNNNQGKIILRNYAPPNLQRTNHLSDNDLPKLLGAQQVKQPKTLDDVVTVA